MSRKPRLKGSPPSTLTGRLPVSAEHSPWWDDVCSRLGQLGMLVGNLYTIEEITQMIPPYPDGRRPRPRAVARRLYEYLELVERGPNGSRGKGAKYKILSKEVYVPGHDDDVVPVDEEWLNSAVNKMTRTKQK